jgi:hypothetical protein
MNRRQKYPNTKTFRFFNANPKGRITGDCRIRAICTATKVDYNKVVMDLAEIQCETGYDQCTNQGIDILLERYGWEKQRQPRKANGTKYTGKEFCKLLNKSGGFGDGIVANIGGHHEVAIMSTDPNDPQENWKVFDIWDSTDGSIGNYWIKKASTI